MRYIALGTRSSQLTLGRTVKFGQGEMGTVEVVAVETGALTEGTERARVPTMEVLALGKMSPPSPSERGL